MATLDIHFRGVCAHFWNHAVPGIPHRVVLPDAGTLRAGLLSFANATDPTKSSPYFLLPHFAIVSMTDQTFTQTGIVDAGVLSKGVHLRIANAVDNGITWDPSFQQVAQLTTFLTDYAPSNDVVTGARAAAYFDIFSGTVSSFKDGDDVRVKVSVETDGPPLLRISPMTPDDQALPSVPFTLGGIDGPTEALIIGNVSPFCLDGCDFDFLLHYLTDVSGIPRVLTTPAPGMPGGPNGSVINALAALGRKHDHHPDPVESLKKLIESGWPLKLLLEELFPLEDFETSASCSDSRYP